MQSRPNYNDRTTIRSWIEDPTLVYLGDDRRLNLRHTSILAGRDFATELRLYVFPPAF